MKARIPTTPVFRGIIVVRAKRVALKTGHGMRMTNSIKNRKARSEVKRFWLNPRSLEKLEERIQAKRNEKMVVV